jgi:hypothetical protein
MMMMMPVRLCRIEASEMVMRMLIPSLLATRSQTSGNQWSWQRNHCACRRV